MQKKSYKIPLITSCLGISFAFLFIFLTFIPNQTFAEVVNPETRTMDDIHYMQEMNTNICATAKLEQQYQLIDIRDGKTYFVARLKDNNCWMTQNLDYDIESTLYPATSDVREETFINTTPVSKPGEWISTDAEANYYYDSDQNLDKGEHYYYTHPGYGQSSICPNTKNGLSDCTNNKRFTFQSLGNGAEENHYLVGNYYSWYAATAQSGTKSIVSEEAPSSICPKGWKLPISNNISTTPASFNALMSAYNINDNFYAEPLYFVYSGVIFSGHLSNAGIGGWYWSSIPLGSDSAHDLDFYESVDPFSDNLRYNGMSIRCVNNPLITTSENLSTPDIPPAHGTASISVTVSPVISLDVATSSTSDKMTAEFTKVSTSEIITNVSSNYQYTVSISTEQTTLEQDPKTEYNIPMIGTGTNGNGKDNVEKNVSGWGIKKKLSATNPEELGSTKDEDKYSPVGIGSAHPEVFYKSNGAEALTNDKALVFEVGVGVDAKLPSGIYFTTVTLTASVI